MKKIQLTKGEITIINDEDYPAINQFNWQFDGHYAQRANKKSDGLPRLPRRTILLHRALMGLNPRDKVEVDHINGDKLDNRRSNLRLCTRSQNMMNQKKKKGTSSSYKGVYYFKRGNKWQAQIKINGKITYLGRFSTEDEAASIYNQAAKKYFGKFTNVG